MNNFYNPPVRVTTGSYTGNGVQNRAIPHGLGARPSIVILKRAAQIMFILGAQAAIIGVDATFGFNTYVVTQADETNFYVGDVSGAVDAGNYSSGGTYDWVAIR